MSDFQLDDQVQWTSQANASAITKRGFIVAVVKPGQKLSEALPPHCELYDLSPIRTSLNADTRRHDIPSYLVRVGKTRGKPLLYWPRVNALKLVKRP